MGKVIDGTKAKKEAIAVTSSGHPATFRKIRCTACSVGYMVKANTGNAYTCTRCGASVRSVTM